MKKTLVSVLLTVHATLAAAAQEPPIPIEGLVVSASPLPRMRSELPMHVTVLDGEELRASGLSRVEEALRGQAGLSVARNGSIGAVSSLFLRGGESDYVLVLVDGVQVNQPGGAFDFSSLTLANVERIEIVRGPASALYGSGAVAGVVHVITHTGLDGAAAQVETRMGSYGRRDWGVSASGGDRAVGYALSLSRETTDGILPFNNEHRHTVFSGAMRFRPSGATEADLSVRLGNRQYHYPTDGSGQVVDRNAFAFGDESVVSARVMHTLSPALTISTRLGVSETDGGTDDAPDGPADTLGFYGFTSLDHLRRASADVRAHVTVSQAVLTLGGELESERQRSFTESLSQFGPSNGRSANARDNQAAYAHVTGSQGPLTLTAGARLENNERFGRLGTWQLGITSGVPSAAGVRVRASIASGIKEPTFFENYATGFAVGNVDLDPERTLSRELGFDAQVAGGVAEVGLTVFDQSFRDLIQFTFTPPAPGDPSFHNVAAADSRGLELAASARMGRLGARGTWTWLDTEVLDSGFDSGPGATFVEGEPLIRRARHVVDLSADLRAGAGRAVFAGLRRVGVRPDRDFSVFPAEAVDLPAYTTVRVGGSIRLGGGERLPAVTLTFGGENLLDASYQEVFGFDAPGRQLFIGGRVRAGSGS